MTNEVKNVELWDLLDKDGNKIGRLHERGKPLSPEYYFLTVHVWIQNSGGEFLISRRSADRGHLWHTTGGCVVSGDDSFTSALRETREEIGLILDSGNARFFGRFTVNRIFDDGYMFQDVWLFRQDVDISAVVMQPEEVCGVMWASIEKINQMIAEGVFVPISEWYPYLSDFFTFCEM